jgi:hypothetical protein
MTKETLKPPSYSESIITRMRLVLSRVIREYRYCPDDTRAYDREEDQCVYTTATGRHCAVGMHLLEKNQSCHWEHNCHGLEEFGAGHYCEGKHRFAVSDGLDAELQPEYRGLPIGFWNAMQDFHDSDNNWEDFGLTENGMDRIRAIKADWNLERAHHAS